MQFLAVTMIQYWHVFMQGAKSAVHMMAECLSLELKPFFISVTTVIPAWVKSDIINNAPPSYGRQVLTLPVEEQILKVLV